ncbi:unnamed protein product [Discosporangium mesarthrocarpum]
MEGFAASVVREVLGEKNQTLCCASLHARSDAMGEEEGVGAHDLDTDLCASPQAPMPDPLNPLLAVRRTSEDVVRNGNHVKISARALEDLAERWSQSGVANTILHGAIGWDACGWHYSDDVANGGEKTCQYIFVLDSLNFCFWPTRGLEYEHLASGLKSALQKDPDALSADNLLTMTEERLAGWFSGFDVPQAAERVGKLRELGAVLANHFEGKAVELVARAQGSAARLVRLLVSLLPGFRDEAVYRGKQCFFYKRAQILAGDLWAAFKGQGLGGDLDCVGKSSCAFHDVGDLTMFADYRIPQLLNHFQIVEYSKDLQRRVNSLEEVPAGSEEEVEIRAACVQAVELLRAAMGTRGTVLLSIEIDWLLWHTGEDMKEDIMPHHRTRTIFY